MDNVESLVKSSLAEIEKVLGTKTVVGDPVKVGAVTLVPLISVCFGFAAGGASGRGDEKQKGEGQGQGGATGGGAHVKPVAVIIISESGETRVEPIIGGLSGAMEKLGETVPNLVDKWLEKKNR